LPKTKNIAISYYLFPDSIITQFAKYPCQAFFICLMALPGFTGLLITADTWPLPNAFRILLIRVQNQGDERKNCNNMPKIDNHHIGTIQAMPHLTLTSICQ